MEKITFFSSALPQVKPAFRKNNVTVVFAVNQKFLPYLAVTLESILAHIDQKNNYDLCVLWDMSQGEAKFPLEHFIKDNVSLRFVKIDFSKLGFNFNDNVHLHFTGETYFRFLIPEIFCQFQRVIYLDADVIVLADLANLLQVSLNSWHLAAVKDFATIAPPTPQFYQYVAEKLKIEPKSYFCAGVLLLNLKLLRQDQMLKKALAVLKQLPIPENVDQDILNCLYTKKTLLLSVGWDWMVNALAPDLVEKVSQNIKLQRQYLNYLQEYQGVKIIHFTNQNKPWKNKLLPREVWRGWWRYAERSPFYLKLLRHHWLNLLLPAWWQRWQCQLDSFAHLYGSLGRDKLKLIFARGKRKESLQKKIKLLQQQLSWRWRLVPLERLLDQTPINDLPTVLFQD